MERKRASDGNTREAFLIRQKRREVRALHEAVESGSLSDVIERLEEAGGDVLFQLRGRNALQLAAQRGDPKICAVLCDVTNADVTCTDVQGNSLLHLACAGVCQVDDESAANLIHLLADKGCPLTDTNEDGLSPIHLAALGRRSVSLRALLEHADCDLSSQSGCTALHYAVSVRDNDQVMDQLLAAARCPLDATETHGRTALHMCVCRQGDSSTWRLQYAKTLLEAGCSTELSDSKHRTPLVNAVIERDLGMTKLLLRYGADYNTRVREKHLESLLSLAFVNSCPEIADLLIGIPDLDINRQASNGRTALHYCVEQSTDFGFYCSAGVTLPYLLRKMLEAGADPNVRDSAGETPLHLVVRIGDEQLWEMLVGSGADIHLTTADGSTLLHLAVAHISEPKFFLRVLRSGLEVNKLNDSGQHALHVAIYKRVTDGLLRVLAVREAAAELVSVAGQVYRNHLWTGTSSGGKDEVTSGTPLNIAIRGGQSGWVELLCAYEDTDVNSPDQHKRSPLALACALASPSAFEPCLIALLARKELEVNGFELLPGSGLYTSIPIANLFKHQMNRPAEQVWQFTRILLSRGADPNLLALHDGKHVVNHLLQYDHPLRLVDLLLAHGGMVHVDANAADVLSAAVSSVNPVEALRVCLPLVVGGYPNSLLLGLRSCIKLRREMGVATSQRLLEELMMELNLLGRRVESLKGLCRRVMRGLVLPRPCMSSVRILPLPYKLQDYILLRDHWDDLHLDDELC